MIRKLTIGVPLKKIKLGVLFLLAVPMASVAQNFTKVNTPSLPALTNAKSHWVDFNNDGLPDLFISGLSDGGSLQTTVYLSNGNATFNAISLTALADIAFDFGDY